MLGIDKGWTGNRKECTHLMLWQRSEERLGALRGLPNVVGFSKQMGPFYTRQSGFCAAVGSSRWCWRGLSTETKNEGLKRAALIGVKWGGGWLMLEG